MLYRIKTRVNVLMGDEDYMKIHSLLYGVKVYENLLSSLGVKGFYKTSPYIKAILQNTSSRK